MLEFTLAQSVFSVDQLWIRTPEHQPPDRVGETLPLYAESLLLETLGSFVIGGKKDLEGGAVFDLRVKLPARSGAGLDLMAGRFLKSLSDFSKGRNEIGRDRCLHLIGISRHGRN